MPNIIRVGGGGGDIDYEVSQVSGSGTFIANGEIVLVVSVQLIDDYRRLAQAKYLCPSISTDAVNFFQPGGYADYLTLEVTNPVTLKYTNTATSWFNQIIILSRKG